MKTSERTPSPEPRRWLLLIHQIPPKPAYLRVKVRRRLQALGAVPIKNSVYALPCTDSAQEDLAWVAREVTAGGGEALVCAASLLAGLSDEEVEASFQKARGAEYAGITQRARLLERALSRSRGARDAHNAVHERALRRLEQQLASAVALDFCEAPGREIAEGLIAGIASRLRSQDRAAQAAPRNRIDLSTVSGRTWVTRRGIHVDRIASAWLIRRFIDREATFRFVSPRGYAPLAGEIRFDMYEAEFTHDGDRCTFEVLLDAAGLKQAGLRAIAEIVHDIDLKDTKFGRPETPGVAHLLEGIAAASRDDAARLERGAALFDDLLTPYRRKSR
jgi:hypothetical protein